MLKTYESPKIDLLEFLIIDMITASGTEEPEEEEDDRYVVDGGVL